MGGVASGGEGGIGEGPGGIRGPPGGDPGYGGGQGEVTRGEGEWALSVSGDAGHALLLLSEAGEGELGAGGGGGGAAAGGGYDDVGGTPWTLNPKPMSLHPVL